MPSVKTLMLFTSAFPFGKSETFLETEMPYLAKAFSKIIIVHNETFEVKRELPANVSLANFPYNLTAQEKKKALAQLLSRCFWKELVRLHFRYKRTINRGILATMTLSLFKAKKLTQFLEVLCKEQTLQKSEVLLYSYWCNDIAFALSQFKRKYPEVKTVSRAHGWDVYFEVSPFNYLPFRKEILQHLDVVAFISEYGQKYTQAMNPDVPTENQILSRLGVQNTLRSHWENAMSSDGIFRMVSCSNLILLKRVDLLVKSLSALVPMLKQKKVAIEWVHFGDGAELAKVKALAKQLLKGKMSFTFKGRVANKQVLTFYFQHKVDVFVNLSTSEGIPVSIMEALSFSIPVIATRVGGVAEIINASNGVLLSPNPAPEEVAHQVKAFIQLTQEERIAKSKAAWETWHQHYNAEENYPSFIKMLDNLL